MTTIDWSKAPEGATHYRARIKTFYKQDVRAYEWDTVEWRMISNDLGEFRWSSDLIERPAIEWTGEGLPPAGLDVEIVRGACSWIPTDEWMIGEYAKVMSSFVNSAGHGIAAVQFENGHCECIISDCLKPIRTPEQIAAEERENFIDECENFSSVTNKIRDVFGMMYDAGYRQKVEK